MDDLFTCAMCHRTLIKARSDEEAMLESKTLWGELEPADTIVICDDCFQRDIDEALAEYHSHPIRHNPWKTS